MTRRALTIGLVVIALSGTLTAPAIAGTRYCGLGTKSTLTTVTTYVGQSWTDRTRRLMQTRKRWSSTSTYYVCSPGR